MFTRVAFKKKKKKEKEKKAATNENIDISQIFEIFQIFHVRVVTYLLGCSRDIISKSVIPAIKGARCFSKNFFVFTVCSSFGYANSRTNRQSTRLIVYHQFENSKREIITWLPYLIFYYISNREETRPKCIRAL